MKTMLFIVAGLLFSCHVMAGLTDIPSSNKLTPKCTELMQASKNYDISGNFKGYKVTGTIVFATPANPPQAIYLKGNLQIKNTSGKTIDNITLNDFKSLCRDNGSHFGSAMRLAWEYGKIFAEGLPSIKCHFEDGHYYKGIISDFEIAKNTEISFCIKPQKKKVIS